MTKSNYNKQNTDTTQNVSMDSDQYTTNALQSLTEGCFQVDGNSIVTFWNKKAEHILSVSRTTVIGKNFWEASKNTLSVTLLENFHKAVDTNLALTFETYAEQPNMWLEVSAIPSVNGLFVYLKNISERKIALQQLQNERQKYDDLFNRSPVPQWVYEIQGFKFLDVNEAAILHYGYSRAEFLTMTIKDIRPKEEIPAMRSICAKLVPGYFSTSNVKHQKKNGEIIIVTVEGNSLRFGDENARLVTVIDRTLEIKNSEALKTSVDRYNTVSKATSDAIWDWNMVTNTMVWNHGIKDLFGHPKIKYTDSWWQEHIHPEDLDRVLQKFNLAISSKKNRLKIEYQFRKANGSYSVVLDRAYISYSRGGTPIRAIGSMQDITDQVATLKALEFKNDRLREITWIQSHKVKDPLMKLMSVISLMNLNNTDLVAINEMIPFLKHLGSQLDVAMKEIVEKSSLSG